MTRAKKKEKKKRKKEDRFCPFLDTTYQQGCTWSKPFFRNTFGRLSDMMLLRVQSLMQVSTPGTKRLCKYVTISAPLSLQISWHCNSLWRHRRTCFTARCGSRADVTPSGTYTLSFFFFFFFFFCVPRAMLNGQAGCHGEVGSPLKGIHPTPQFLPNVHRLEPARAHSKPRFPAPSSKLCQNWLRH